MLKKTVATVFVSALLATTSLVTPSHAATITNGAACAKAGASTTVKVKGVSKVYKCAFNPLLNGIPSSLTATPSASPSPSPTVSTPVVNTWTSSSCLTAYAKYKEIMDTLTGNISLFSSQPSALAQLLQTIKTTQSYLVPMRANQCKAGL
jgi:hypothetical protein